MKRILGLDLGTNSIGWALVEIDHENGLVKILGIGSRIIPMDAGEIKDFESQGKIKSSASDRTTKRSVRKLNERFLLRRDRLHLVLNLLDALPKHYQLQIHLPENNEGKGKNADGKFKENKEPKLAYLPKQKGKKAEFLFMDSYLEMLNDINHENVENKKGKKIPYDWTLYYLRQKALSEKITLEELAWVLLSYNQKRGYEKIEVEDKSTKDNEIVDELDLRVKKVKEGTDESGRKFFEVYLEGNDNFVYKEFSDIQMTFEGDLKEVIKITGVDETGVPEKGKTKFKVVDIYPLKIQDVEYIKENGKHNYTLTYQTGWKELKQSKDYTYKYKDAGDKPYDYIVETIYDFKGDIEKQKGKKRKLREPDFGEDSSDWTLLKKRTEKEALKFNSEKGFIEEKSGKVKKYISPQIYDTIKKDASSSTGKLTKINGGKFQVVDRDFYREELKQIISTQKEYHQNLKDKQIVEKCVNLLYPKNANHRKAILENKDAIQHLLTEDILLYQRPLKSKKSEISNCKYEIRYWKDIVDEKTGEIFEKQTPIYHKVVPASHPYFQEFRIWDKLHNLRLIQLESVDKETGEIKTNVDVTKKYFKGEKEYQMLFEKLNNQKSLNQHQFLTFCKEKFKIKYKKKDSNYVWNFPEDEEIKGNETRVSFATRFKRCGFDYKKFLSQEKEFELWHYLYSVSYRERTARDKKTGKENKSARSFFNNFFKGIEISEEVKEKIINDFVIYPKFPSRYCAYSEKAIKKLLPVIRLAEKNEADKWEKETWYIKWQESLLIRKKEILRRLKKFDFTAEQIDYSKVIETEVDYKKAELPFPRGLFNTFGKSDRPFEDPEAFTKLNLTQASYLIYGRHSELAQEKFWTSPKQIRAELHNELKQHSLNNPIAEKVLLEMMQIVADIWEQFGDSKEKFFSKIHVEVGRELKQSAKDKKNAYDFYFNRLTN